MNNGDADGWLRAIPRISDFRHRDQVCQSKWLSAATLMRMI